MGKIKNACSRIQANRNRAQAEMQRTVRHAASPPNPNPNRNPKVADPKSTKYYSGYISFFHTLKLSKL